MVQIAKTYVRVVFSDLIDKIISLIKSSIDCIGSANFGKLIKHRTGKINLLAREHNTALEKGLKETIAYFEQVFYD